MCIDKRLVITLIVLCGLLLIVPQLARAQSNEATESAPLAQQQVVLAPTRHLYLPNLADQQRVTFGLQVLHMLNSTIPETGSSRFALRMGGRLELFNWTQQSNPVQQLQANLEVGFRGHFDIDHTLDNIGWDGNYGLLFSYRRSDSLAYRFGLYHNSSHIGDEYIERTARERINYTREETLLGMQYTLTPDWQYYLETGIARTQDSKPLQKRHRLQTGIQFQPFNHASGWYAGLDFSAYEENGWSINRALQIGFALNAAPHIWRIAFDYYRGRSTMGEFFQHQEEYVGLSLYLDV